MQYVLRVGLSESLQGIAAINRSTEVKKCRNKCNSQLALGQKNDISNE